MAKHGRFNKRKTLTAKAELGKTESSRPRTSQQLDSSTYSDLTTQQILQVLYIQGIDALNTGEYFMAIDRLSQVQGFANYRDVSIKLSEAKAKLAEQEKKSELHRGPSLEHLTILFSVIFGFLSALINSTLTFIADVSKPWGAGVLAVLYLIGLAIVFWARKKFGSFRSTSVNPDD